MASWQSKFINFTYRNRHLMQGHLKREAWDENTSIPAFREMCESGAAKVKMPAGVEAVPVKIDGLPAGLAAEWLQPAAGSPIPLVEDAVIFYTHGGGYVSGSCSDHRALVAKIVAVSGVRLLLFEYRLAPEHPYPAAVEDTLTAYNWLLGQVAPTTKILIAGESAGGGLCLAALLAMKDQGLPMPLAGISISPMTDLKLTGKPNRGKHSIEPEGMAEVCCKHYVGDNDPSLPYISPLYGDLRGLPPLLMFVGGDEGILDDAVRFTDKAEKAGVDIKLIVGEGQIHCYPLLPDFIPESKQGMDEIGAFIRKHISETPQPVYAD
jgi:monoterpene epsilon-lactone hydrolase